MLRGAWLALVVGFLSQNLSIGLAFGSIGLLVDVLGREFAANRATVSLGIALVTLMMGFASPLVGRLLDRWSIKRVMITGSAVGAVGYWAAAHATSIGMFLVAFGVLGGTAAASAGTLAVTKLASNWFERAPGRAIAFVNMPVVLAAGPPVFASVIAGHGWRTLLSAFSVAFVLLIPLLLLLRDGPGRAHGAVRPGASAASKPAVPERWADSLADRRLWLIVLIGGGLLSSGVVLVTHIIAYALGHEVPLESASLLVSVEGAAAVVGAMFYGWLSDALTPRVAVSINALCQILLWPLLLMQHQFAGMAIVVALLATCTGGAFPSLSALLASIFGAHRVGTVVGQFLLLVVPFNFGAAPLAGFFYDVVGSYIPAFLLQAALCFAALTLLVLGRRIFGALASTADRSAPA